MKNYHELQSSPLTKKDFLNILQYIGEQDCLVVYMIDLFDFNGSIIPGLTRHVNDNDILVLANKRDLLPKSLNDRRLKQWLQRQLKMVNIKPKDVILTSAKKNYNFDEIMAAIETYRKGRNVYVVGVTNVGKSSFINALLKNYTTEHDQFITTSEFPGTTLDLIEIPFDEETSLFDSPGIVNEDQFTHIIPAGMLDTILPKSEIKPMSFQLDSKQSVYVGGLARFDYIEGERQPIIFYFSNKLKMHRTKTINADRIYNQHNVLSPELPDIENIDQMKKYQFALDGKSDVVISGLGFIKIDRKAVVQIYVPEKVSVFIRETLI